MRTQRKAAEEQKLEYRRLSIEANHATLKSGYDLLSRIVEPLASWRAHWLSKQNFAENAESVMIALTIVLIENVKNLEIQHGIEITPEQMKEMFAHTYDQLATANAIMLEPFAVPVLDS